MKVSQESTYDDVVKATVTFLRKEGQGILVNGNLILTAAHCIDFSCEGEMALDHHFIEDIKTIEGELKVAPLCVEPVSDIVVLGSLDGQTFFKESMDFEKFCQHTKPIPLCQNDFALFQQFKVHIYTHKGTWVTGSAMQCQEDAHALWIDFDEQIEGGTSGGPIINDVGELVGIVSTSSISEGERKCMGASPRPHLALPIWVCRQIFGKETRHLVQPLSI